MEEQVTPASFEKVVEGAFQALQITDKPVGNTEALTYKERHEIELEKLAAEVEELPTVIDKRTRQLNQDQLTKLVRTGSRLDDLRIETFRPITTLKKEWDGYIGTTKEAGLRGRIAAMEQAVKKNIEAFDQAEERKRQEELRKAEEKNTARRKQLLARKMSFDGTTFAFEQFTALAEQVYAATDENFSKVLVKLDALVAAKAQREADELAAKKKRDEEQAAEAARLKAENDRLAAERKKLDDERAEFNRQKEEREAKERGDRWFAERSTELRLIGAVALPDAEGRLTFRLGDVSVTENELRTINPVQWDNVYEWFLDQARKDVGMEPLADAPTAIAEVPFTEQYNGGPVIEIPAEIAPEVPDELVDAVLENSGPAFAVEEVDNPVLAEAKLSGCVDTLVTPPDLSPEAEANEVPVDEFNGEPMTIESAVFQALGEASVCWDPRPTGVFDSTRCKEVGDRLVATLKKLEAANWNQ